MIVDVLLRMSPTRKTFRFPNHVQFKKSGPEAFAWGRAKGFLWGYSKFTGTMGAITCPLRMVKLISLVKGKYLNTAFFSPPGT